MTETTSATKVEMLEILDEEIKNRPLVSPLDGKFVRKNFIYREIRKAIANGKTSNDAP